MNNLLSVIVPVYNAGEYLIPLANSILGQTYKNIELILVDDGSSDGSGKICDELANNDARVKVVHMKNGGQSAARNTGLEIAKGDFIAFADHDDLIHPQMYEIMIRVILESNMPVCICNYDDLKKEQFDGIIYKKKNDLEITSIFCEEWLHGFLKPTWRTPIWNKLYRKEAVKNIRFGDLRLGEDNLFSYQVFKENRKAIFVHKALYFHRMHGENFEYTGVKYLTDLLKAKEIILNDVKKAFQYEYNFFKTLFLYECVRILNEYISIDGDLYNEQKKIVINMIKKNTRGICFLNMSLGRKLLFLKLKYKSADLINEPIIM